jgi:hypothetical protein
MSRHRDRYLWKWVRDCRDLPYSITRLKMQYFTRLGSAMGTKLTQILYLTSGYLQRCMNLKHSLYAPLSCVTSFPLLANYIPPISRHCPWDCPCKEWNSVVRSVPNHHSLYGHITWEFIDRLSTYYFSTGRMHIKDVDLINWATRTGVFFFLLLILSHEFSSRAAR